MNGNDLIIGTIIERKLRNDWCFINVNHEDIYSISCGERKLYRPIDVNFEWLLKLGFLKLNDNKYYYDSLDIEIEIHNDTYSFYYKQKFIKTIRYIHDICNLSYILTDVMLNVKR